MNLVASLASECDADLPVVESPPIANGKTWNNAGLFLDGYSLGYNSLVLSFILTAPHGKVLVCSVDIPTAKLVHYPEPYDKRKRSTLSLRTQKSVFDSLERISTTIHNMKITHGDTGAIVHLSYVGYMYRDFADGVTPIGQIRIHSLSFDYDLSKVVRHHGHQITCMINDNYLGRAQECITCDTARCMSWKPTDEWASLTPRGENDFEHIRQEGWELACIRRANPAGIGTKLPNFDILIDNDAYSNPVRRIPKFLTEKETPVRIRFYNFKFNPPRMVETFIKWKDFQTNTCLLFLTPRLKDVKTPRRRLFGRTPSNPSPTPTGTIERTLITGMTLRLFYSLVDDGSRVKIDYVKVHIADYDTTLDMDEMQQAQTI